MREIQSGNGCGISTVQSNTQSIQTYSCEEVCTKSIFNRERGSSSTSQGDDSKALPKAVDMIKADLGTTCQCLQEVIQVEGDRNFDKLFDKISVVKSLSVPVIVKEVGSGLDPRSTKILEEIGVAAVDIGGAGGTSWGHIEGLRAADKKTQNLAEIYRDWGIPQHTISRHSCRLVSASHLQLQAE